MKNPRLLFALIVVIVISAVGIVFLLNSGIFNPLAKVSVSGKTLVTANGKEFRVWGQNYTNIGDKLIEDDWDSQEGWKKIESNFSEMKDLGANTVRIHLQHNKFMDAPDKPNTKALKNLQRLVTVAEGNKLYLIVTGTGTYRKQDVPIWYDALSEADRWASQAVFWENVAGAIGKSPGVLAYDLMNEPVVAVDAAKGWLPGEGLGGFYFIQNISRDLKGRAMPEVMRAWINTMDTAIKQKDSQTLITVGFLPFPNLTQFSPDLDVMSFHVYPKKGELSKADSLIQNFQTDKPLIISETYPLTASAAEIKQFILQNNPYVNGWVGHYRGRTLADLKSSTDIPSAVQKSWLELFKELAPSQQ